MIATLIFSLAVTSLCCYTVHILLKERQETRSSIADLMSLKDLAALQTPLKITIKHQNSQKTQKLIKDMCLQEIVNITPKKDSRFVNNQYPIKPQNILTTGFGLDVRV